MVTICLLVWWYKFVSFGVESPAEAARHGGKISFNGIVCQCVGAYMEGRGAAHLRVSLHGSAGGCLSMAYSGQLISSHSCSVGVEAYLDIENNFRSAQVLSPPVPMEGSTPAAPCRSCYDTPRSLCLIPRIWPLFLAPLSPVISDQEH